MAKTKETKSDKKVTKVTKSDKKVIYPKKSKKAAPKVNDCNKNDCKCQKQIADMKKILKRHMELSKVEVQVNKKVEGPENTKVLRKLQYMVSQNTQRGY